MATDPTIPLLEMRRVSRHFGQIIALSEIDFAVYPGKIVALLGDNRAGKSTLIKVLTGVHPPSEGQLFSPAAQSIWTHLTPEGNWALKPCTKIWPWCH